MFVNFFEGRVPCWRWACVRRRSGHSDWIWIQDERVVKGTCDTLLMSWEDVDRTTESSVVEMKLQT